MFDQVLIGCAVMSSLATPQVLGSRRHGPFDPVHYLALLEQKTGARRSGGPLWNGICRKRFATAAPPAWKPMIKADAASMCRVFLENVWPGYRLCFYAVGIYDCSSELLLTFYASATGWWTLLAPDFRSR